MKFAICAAMAALLAPVATAQTFCDSLKAALAAGAEAPAPFDSLADPDKKFRDNGELASFGPATVMAGLPDGAKCERYLAYVSGKVVGGGEHNFYSCRFGATSDADAAALKAAQDTLAGLVAATEACLAPLGWRKGERSDIYNRGARSQTLAFTKTGEPMVVHFGAEGRGARNGGPLYWTFTVEVRTPASKPAE